MIKIQVGLRAGPQLITVIEHAADTLRAAIMRGELLPGHKLVEADLCARMGISRASLREALRALESERLIDLIPNRGPFVAQLGWKEIEDIHDVWAMLTGEAVYRFVEGVQPADLAMVGRIGVELAAAVESEQALEQLAATNALFMFFLERCGNRVLIEMIFSLVSRLNFLRAQSLRHEGWGHLSLHEIQEIIAAVEAKSPQAARTATQRHINSACAAAKQVAMTPRREPSR